MGENCWILGFIKNLPANAGDTGDMALVLGLGRWQLPQFPASPRVGNGNPLQYSCLENSMLREVWKVIIHRVAKSWTWPTPTVLLGFLLPWTWGISSQLLLQNVAVASYFGRGESPHGHPSWLSSSRPSCTRAAATPWTWGCSSQHHPWPRA